MKRRIQIGALIILSAVALLVWSGQLRGSGGIAAVFTGVEREDRFIVPNPTLRLDLLKEATQYTGMQRNIFKATPLPPAQPPVKVAPTPPVDPNPPQPVDPPLVLPFKYYGYVSSAKSPRLRGFFTNGDDIMMATEGETVARRFILVHLSIARAEFEEISTKKRATLQLDESAAPASAN